MSEKDHGHGNPQAGQEEAHGYFPFEYLADFLRFLNANRDIIRIITYNDLPWGGDYSFADNYPEERKRWQRLLKEGKLDKENIHVLLQHDADSAAERTMAVLREEERLGIPSNVMIFHRRISRRHLQNTGELRYTAYDLDYDCLRRLQDEAGFVIGYHCNAYGRSLFDTQEALRIFEEDVAALREHFDIRFFSPHGGARGPDGLTNRDLPIPDALRRSLRWVHNGYSVRFDGSYSDGGINSPARDPRKRDLRDFVATWRPGKRYRVLLHPQYYHTPCEASPRLKGTPWYDQLLAFYRRGGAQASAWEGVRIR